MPKFEVQANHCKVCEKRVYPMEELIADNIYYHKPCFRCHKCNRTLSTGSYASLEGQIYCKPHFLQLFKQKGNYEEGFGKERHKLKWVEGAKVEANLNGDAPDHSIQPMVTKQADKENASIIEHTQLGEDSSSDGVKEERTPISLEFKKSKLWQSVDSNHNRYNSQKPVPGKLTQWQPGGKIDGSVTNGTRQPSKLSSNWGAKVSSDAKTDTTPEWVSIARRRANSGVKYQEVNSVKSKFENGELGKKEFSSDVRDEVDKVISDKHGVALSVKNKFESGELEKKDYRPETRLEVESVIKTAAANKKLEKVEYDRAGYNPMARIEAEAIRQALPGKAAEKVNRFETGNVERPAYESEARKEVAQFKRGLSAVEKRHQFESGQYSDEKVDNDVAARKEVEIIRGTGAASNVKNKFETGDYEKVAVVSMVKEEIEQMKTISDASVKKQKFESGELITQEFDSEVRKELESLSTGALEAKTKFEKGEYEHPEYESEVKKEIEVVRKVVPGASTIKSKYQEAVEEGNKIITSKPVEIEKAPPQIYTREPEQYTRTQEDYNTESDEENGYEYVAPVEPGKLTNVMERFQKPAVEKPAPMVNKLQIPTFTKQQESDDEEVHNGDIPTEEETLQLKEQLWTVKASSLKERFENKAHEDEVPKETPKPIDLEAEISAYEEHLRQNRPKRPKPSKRKSLSANDQGNNDAPIIADTTET